MCHAPAKLFRIKTEVISARYYADLVLVNPGKSYTVTPSNILYKCGWSPLEGKTFSHAIEKTFVNGYLVFDNGMVNTEIVGKPLEFNL